MWLHGIVADKLHFYPILQYVIDISYAVVQTSLNQ